MRGLTAEEADVLRHELRYGTLHEEDLGDDEWESMLARYEPLVRRGLLAKTEYEDDDEFHANSRAHVLQERKFLGQALTALGIRWLPSQANFMLLTHLPLDAEGCFEALLRRGIIVRPMGGWGVPNAIRVSLGTRRDNLRFLAALREMLDGVRPRD